MGPLGSGIATLWLRPLRDSQGRHPRRGNLLGVKFGNLVRKAGNMVTRFRTKTNTDTRQTLETSRGRIIKTLVKLQCSTPCISSYNMKATMCQQCCKSGSSKIYKFIVGRLYVLLRRAHCSQHMASYNMEQRIRERVPNYST